MPTCMSSIYKEQNNALSESNKDGDGVINDFLSWYTHVLVSLLFHEVTFLHPPSFDFSYVSFVATSYNCAYVTISETFFFYPSRHFSCTSASKREVETVLYTRDIHGFVFINAHCAREPCRGKRTLC